MRNPLKRYYGRGDLHFVTFSCYRRQPFLGAADARDGFVRALEQVRSKKHFLLLGYVVMPEHVHLLVSEPEGSDPSKVLQVLKQSVSRALRKKNYSDSRVEGEPFWPRRFYDFNVWSESKFKEKLEYACEPGKERTSSPSLGLGVE